MNLSLLVPLSILLLALWAAWVYMRRRLRRGLLMLGVAAVGAVLGFLFNEGILRFLGRSTPEPAVPATALAPGPATPAPQPASEPPAGADPSDAPGRTGKPPPPQIDAVQSHPPAPTRTTPSEEVRRPAARESGGGIELLVVGGLDAAAAEELRSAVLAELHGTAWSGLSGGGTKRLRISGTMRDLEPTLGQIPTASISASWTLQTRTGHVLAQGGVSDLRGTGLDQGSARTAAVQWAARDIAAQLRRGAP
jgi:hypothetical protein